MFVQSLYYVYRTRYNLFVVPSNLGNDCFLGNSTLLRTADWYQPGHFSRHPEDPRRLGPGGHQDLPGAVPGGEARGRYSRKSLAVQAAHVAAARSYCFRLG